MLQKLQFEAVWLITNLASGETEDLKVLCKEIVELGTIPRLVELFRKTPYTDVQEQIIWALGNFAGDSILIRDTVIAAGGLEVYKQAVQLQKTTISML